MGQSGRGHALTAAASVITGAVVGGLVNVFTSSQFNWWLVAALVMAVLTWAVIEAGRAGHTGRTRATLRAAAAFPESDGPRVDRPEPLGEIVRALTTGSRRTGPVVAIVGGGGFGKTTLARMAAEHPEVRRRFPTALTVVLGQDVTGPALATKLNDVSERVTGLRPGFVSAEQAAQHLGDALDKHDPMLLVIDDVWAVEQESYFRYGGRSCARLITTRKRHLIPGAAVRVEVGAMRDSESYDLLTSGVPGLPADVTDRLRERTGRWPLLLAICNGLLRQAVAQGDDPAVVGRRTADLLDREGPTALDRDDSGHRTAGRTIAASMEMLAEEDRDRLAELGVFAEDAEIPEQLVASLWSRTGGLTSDGTVRLCRTLAGLSLVESYQEGARTIRLHDVVRSFLRQRRGEAGLRAANHNLLDAIAVSLTTAAGAPTPWWQVPTETTYVWRHLRYHMKAAGRDEEFDLVATDPRWALTKLRLSGAAAVSEDLTGNHLPAGRRLADQLDRHGHLLAPTEPPEAVVDVFLGRTGETTDLRQGLDQPQGPRLIPLWSLPDLPDPALRRVVRIGKAGYGGSLPWSPDGRLLLVERAETAELLVLNVDTGEPIVGLTGPDKATWPIVFGPDGSWVAGETSDQDMQLWDTKTGQRTTLLTGHRRYAQSAVVSPSGDVLATTLYDKTIRAWNISRPGRARILRGHRGKINAMAASPDGTWLGSVSDDGTGRVWYREDRPALVLVGHVDSVTLAVPAGPDRLVTAGVDRTVRVWDTRTGAPLHVFRRPDAAVCLLPAPDGSWLAIVEPHVITRWDVATWALRSAWKSPTEELTCAAVHPDGSRLVVGARSGEIQVWDVTDGRLDRRLLRHGAEVSAVSVRADNMVLSHDAEDVRLWDLGAPAVVGGAESGRSTDRLVVAPDSSWFAVGGGGGDELTVWDVFPASAHVLTRGESDSEVQALLSGGHAGQVLVARSNWIEVWDVNLKALHSTVSVPFYAGRSMARVAGGKLLSAGMEPLVLVHDAATWEQFGALDTITGRLIAVPPGESWEDLAALHPVRQRLRRVAIWISRSVARLLRPPVNWLVTLEPVRRLVRRLNERGGLTALAEKWNHLLVRLFGPNSWLTWVIASPDGRYAATLHTDGSVRVWETATWRSIGRLVAPDVVFYTSRLSASFVATLYGDTMTYRNHGRILMWSAEDNTTVTVASLRADEGSPTGLAYTPDGKYLCAVTEYGALIVWATGSWERVAMQRVEGALHSCAWIDHLGRPAIVAVGGRGVYLFGLSHEPSTDRGADESTAGSTIDSRP